MSIFDLEITDARHLFVILQLCCPYSHIEDECPERVGE